jgi:hypothetical protein
MSVRYALAVLGLALLSPGCMLVSATHVLSYRLCQSVEDCAERQRNARWAEESWEAVAGRCPGLAGNDDYARGFKEGLAEYLYRGAVDPPVLPPKRYRSVRYQTAQGYRAIEDWFNGYRRGVAVAHDGKHREWVTGPSSLRPPATVAPGPAAPVPQNLPAPAVSQEQAWNWRIKVRLPWDD